MCHLRIPCLLISYRLHVIIVGSEKENARLLKLQLVVTEFEANYTAFASRNQFLRSVESEVHKALQVATKENDIKHAARVFANKITASLQAEEEKQAVLQVKWRSRLVKFIVKLYLIVRLSLEVTSLVADVTYLDDRL